MRRPTWNPLFADRPGLATVGLVIPDDYDDIDARRLRLLETNLPRDLMSQ